MATPRPPFRADHVGSLLRPPALKALRLKKESGQASAEELAAAGVHRRTSTRFHSSLPAVSYQQTDVGDAIKF